MKKAIVLTAFNRPSYLKQVLESWSNVRGAQGWDFIARIEPSELEREVRKEFEDLDLFGPEFASFQIITNDMVLGVLEHPYVAFQDLFDDGYDFVVRAEDDLLVSDDILEFFSWVAETYEEDGEILTAVGFTEEVGADDRVRRARSFDPWVWGTWRDRWESEIGPTWDHDYSTYNDFPGNQSGWDWNLNTRIIPRLGYQSIYPLASRVQNIGEYGIHGTPENIRRTSSFEEYRGACRYREISTSR